jgi:hypothetical protein
MRAATAASAIRPSAASETEKPQARSTPPAALRNASSSSTTSTFTGATDPGGAVGTRAGSRTVKRLPVPGSLESDIEPPRISTNRFA